MIKFLLQLYPAAWRREYGGELAELLSSRPLTLRAITNVVASATRQRLRRTPPWLASAALQFFAFLTWLLLQLFGLLSPLGVRLIFPVEIAIQLATGVWIVTRRNGSFVAGLAGTMSASLLAYAPLLLLMMLISPQANFPDRTLMIHMSRVNAESLFEYVMFWAAITGAIGAICGTMIKRSKGRLA